MSMSYKGVLFYGFILPEDKHKELVEDDIKAGGEGDSTITLEKITGLKARYNMKPDDLLIYDLLSVVYDVPMEENDMIISTQKAYFNSDYSQEGKLPDLSNPTPAELQAFVDVCAKLEIEMPELKWIVSYNVC